MTTLLPPPPAPPFPPAMANIVPMMLAAPAPAASRPYWRKLIVLGFGALVLAGVFYGMWSNGSSDDYGYGTETTHSGGEALAALLFAGLGQLLLIPGLIGWGIHASGLVDASNRER